MASERVELPIGDVCNVKQGRYLAPGAMSETQTDDTAIPVIGANGILGYTGKPSYSVPVTLVTCRGSNCGLIQRTQGPAWISNNAMACPPKPPHDSLYLHYVLSSIDYADVTTGSAQPQITTGHLNTKRITITRDPNEQKAIARILGTLDDKIELNRRMNATLEAMARALFQSWFVDFDPVHAKAAGRPPAGMDAETAALFPGRFQVSDHGLIPKGWRIRPIQEMANINYGRNLPATELLPSGFPVYGAAGVVGFYSSSMFDEPVTLVASRGSGSGTVHQTYEPAFVTNNSFIITPRENWLSRHYLRLSLLNADILSLVTGSAQPQLTITNFAYLKLLEPSREVATAFNHILGTLWSKAAANDLESRTLATLRDTLLPKLLSGEISIP